MYGRDRGRRALQRQPFNRGRAFVKQSEEVRAIEQQMEDQRKANEQQAKVLELQARDLRQSLKERERDAARRVRAQAALVFLTEERFTGRQAGPLDSPPPKVTATVVNSSDQPVYEAEVFWRRGSVKLEAARIGVICGTSAYLAAGQAQGP